MKAKCHAKTKADGTPLKPKAEASNLEEEAPEESDSIPLQLIELNVCEHGGSQGPGHLDPLQTEHSVTESRQEREIHHLDLGHTTAHDKKELLQEKCS